MNYKQNLNILNEFHLGMFEYKNAPDTFLTNYLEYYFIKNGMVAAFRIPEGKGSSGFPAGSLIVTTCSLGTELNPYGRGAEVIAVTKNGWEFRADRYSDKIAVGFNNLSELPCQDIKSDAEILAEVDKSIKFLVFWTRLAPIIRVCDEKERAEVMSAFKNIKEGYPVTITSKKILKELGLEDNFTVEDLTRPDFADKIQHTARLREDILRWHYTRYGQTIQGDTKLAQQSVDEVNGTVSSSLILPLNMLKARRAFIDEVNRKFNTNIEVELAGSWRAEVTKYENNTGESEIDAEAPDQESDQESDQEPKTEETEGGENNENDGK